MERISLLVLAVVLLVIQPLKAVQTQNQSTFKLTTNGDKDIAQQVIIKRTKYGVPHILADNIKAAGYALGYVQMEDYGKRITNGLLRARGAWSKYHEAKVGKLTNAIDADAIHKRRYLRAVETWPLLSRDTREMMKGFAWGVNRYIEIHPEQFKDWMKPFFTAYDVHAKGIGGTSRSSIQRFMKALKKKKSENKKSASNLLTSPQKNLKTSTLWARLASKYEEPHPDVGSNAWAFAPGRTTSGHAILVRNPHLSWNAGYYEAHVKVSGKLDFYGDFRIGSPLGIIGGFNNHLGWATTNNYPEVSGEIYAFKVDPDNPDHYVLDGSSVPIKKETVKVEFKNGHGTGIESRTFLSTPYGPVIYRGDGKIYIIHSAGDGEYRTGEQFLRMMKSQNLREWKQAMRMQAKTTSNFTYADGDGNIFYVWNASIPDLPEPWGGDTTAVLVTESNQIWKNLIPWDSLPHLKNPRGGYLHNENDPFYYTNMNEVFDKDKFGDVFPEPQFRLRSQKSYELIHDEKQKFSLKDIVDLKYNTGMLLADRVKVDLVKAVEKTDPVGEIADAIRLIENWDNTVAKDSRGSVLFKIWWYRYVEKADSKKVESSPASVGFAATPEKLFEKVWTPDRPVETPYGLADFDRAAKAFKWAVAETKKRYGAWNVAWGKAHRAIAANDINVPISGCSGLLGCFRVIWYNEVKVYNEKRLKARGGDGWVLAVEFDKTPRAYSVLAYGESNKEDSPFYYNQIEMFTNNKMKRVAYTKRDIDRQMIYKYHPGQEK
ncbi:MAG TPA: penicillin acylase family protein [Chitinophagaceae bacterium]|nr:penicillin acylase family protein [Chitinophagaceae bacterium]